MKQAHIWQNKTANTDFPKKPIASKPFQLTFDTKEEYQFFVKNLRGKDIVSQAVGDYWIPIERELEDYEKNFEETKVALQTGLSDIMENLNSYDQGIHINTEFVK